MNIIGKHFDVENMIDYQYGHRQIRQLDKIEEKLSKGNTDPYLKVLHKELTEYLAKADKGEKPSGEKNWFLP